MNPTDCSCQIKKLESDGIELNLALNIFLGQAMTKVNLDEHHQSKFIQLPDWQFLYYGSPFPIS